MSNIYIHYGHDHFDKNIFMPIKNREHPWIKPQARSGLWASRCGIKNDWRSWCESEDFHLDHYLASSFKFKLRDDANVAYISKPSDIDALPLFTEKDWDGLIDRFSRYINFEACVKQGIDAIEILDIYGREPGKIDDFLDNSVYYALYGWDCNSILILNPDIVSEV